MVFFFFCLRDLYQSQTGHHFFSCKKSCELANKIRKCVHDTLRHASLTWFERAGDASTNPSHPILKFHCTALLLLTHLLLRLSSLKFTTSHQNTKQAQVRKTTVCLTKMPHRQAQRLAMRRHENRAQSVTSCCLLNLSWKSETATETLNSKVAKISITDRKRKAFNL